MIIKHKIAQEPFPVTYSEWFHDYLKTGKFKNFTVASPSGVVELHKINPETGEMTFNMLMDKDASEKTRLIKPRMFHIRKLEYVFYDKNLVPNQRYFELHPQSSIRPHFESSEISRLDLKLAWYNLPRLKIIMERITNSIISKEMWFIFRGVLILLIAYVLWAIFGRYFSS